MRRLADAGSEGLCWERVADEPKFEFLAAKEVLGTYELVGKKAVIAQASTELGSWLFIRRRRVFLDFAVRDAHSHAEVATLRLPLRKPGLLTVTHGTRFLVKPGARHEDPWRIVDDAGEEVIRIQRRWGTHYHQEYLAGGEVFISPIGWRLGELDLLVLTGWFAPSWMALIREVVQPMAGAG